MIIRLISSFLFILPAAGVCGAKEWYVGQDGTADNAGTQEQPWDIASALDGKQEVSAGDTILLLGGTYRRRPKELFEVRLTGTGDKPIEVRPAPGGRVRIDGGLSIQSPSAYVRIRDLEIFVSEPQPPEPFSAGSHPEDLQRPWGGVHMYGGKNCKYINLVIHNCNQGISCWKGEIDPEIYGCIIYDNGWLGTDRGHGHCVYTQNDEGIKRISNCIMSCKYDGTYTMHAYGSSRAYVNNFIVEDCVFYDKGPFLIGGGRPSEGIGVFGNYLYNVDMSIGYSAGYNADCEIRDNIIANGTLNIVRYRKAVEQNNLIVKRGQQRPEKAKTVLLPNRFDVNRAHLVIYNWAKTESIEVPAGAFLSNGEAFRLMDPKRLFEKPVFEGECREHRISAPLEDEFAVFVVLKGF
ncbi:MAG: right-handed parallel beta-helix repeat-containing protein [Sedimentisphaerales bacterium]|nr:right-handed parallel beta-helix repeat-containing protein [Sedimentisphaerales bacterium]